MENLILQTKLNTPKIPTGYVYRPFIYKKMDILLERKLCLISTPAGYGKTTLVASWGGKNQSLPLAWVSLDSGDNTFQRFFIYFVLAIQGIHEGFGEGLLDRLASLQSIPNELFLVHLVNELTQLEQDFIVVLDDYHTIYQREIHEAIDFILDYMPENMHFVISTRTEPPLSLSNLRAKGQLVEIRYSDLHFSEQEAGQYLNNEMGLNLDEVQIAELVEYTEGWIVGLHLAALALIDSAKTSSFLAKLNSATTFIVEYLLDEVLKLQPKELYEFLLKTAVMERFTVELCNNALEINNSADLISQVERANLFIVPLDTEKKWYRYHHLFSELLLARLNKRYPEKAKSIWRRASSWFQQQGNTEEAISYALLAEDYQFAASMLDQTGRGILWAGGAGKLLEWFEYFPEEIYYSYPFLWTLSLWAHINLAQFSVTNEELKSQRFDRIAAQIKDQTIRKQFESSAAVLRALLAINWEYNLPKGLEFIEAFDGEKLENDESAAMFDIILGKANSLMGNMKKAKLALERALVVAEENNAHIFRMVINHHYSEMEYFQGNIREFEKNLTDANQIAITHHLDDNGGFFRICIDIGRLHAERGNLVSAQQYLNRGVQESKRSPTAYDILDGLSTIFELALETNNIKAAEQAILSVDDITKKSGFSAPLIEHAEAMRTRLAIHNKDWRAVRDWLDVREIRSRESFAFHERYLAHTAIQALVAFKETELAKAYLDQMIAAAEINKWQLEWANCSAWLALILFQEGDLQQAVAVLKQALKVAKQQGSVRAILEVGEPIMPLVFQMQDELNRENESQKLLTFVNKLIEVYEAMHQNFRFSWCGYDIAEPLTDRELEALELLAKGYPNRVIAEKMVISESTVKFHLKNLYLKLCVHTRTQAIAKAIENGLI